MAFYLEGKISVDTNDLSPKEATAMSRDISISAWMYNESTPAYHFFSYRVICRIGFLNR